MIRAVLLAAGLAGLAGLAGCRLGSFAFDGSCSDARRTTSGTCCPVWWAPDGASCVQRKWQLPEEASGLGESGVRLVSVAVDGAGRPGAGWIEGAGVAARVAVADLSGDPPAIHHPSAALEGEPAQMDVALGPNGEALAIWKHQLLGGEARVFVAERAEGAWSDPTSVEDAFSFSPTAYEPRARFFESGERLVVWNQWMSTGYGIQVATRLPSGDWHRPADAEEILSQHAFFTNAPQIAVNRRGDALISWYQSLGGSLLAWVSERSGPTGPFSQPGPEDHLSVPETPVDSHPFANPRPALSEEGEGAVTWTQENGKGSVLVYLATRTPEGDWTKPADVDDALSPKLGYARCPQIVFTPTGHLFVVWYQDTGGGNRVMAAHRTPEGEWVEPGREPTVLSTPGAEANFPALAAGPEGSVLAVWTERQGDTFVVAARRRVETGTGWGPIEVLSVPNGGPSALPSAAIGGPGDSVVVGWIQGSGASDKVYLATMPAL